MEAGAVTKLARDAIEIALLLSLPIMGVGLLVGLIVSLFQAVTQIHEMTMTFVPKIVAVLISLIFLLPWMIEKMVFYTQELIGSFSQYAH